MCDGCTILTNVHSLANLVNQKREKLNPVLEEDVKLERERLEREEKGVKHCGSTIWLSSRGISRAESTLRIW